MEVYVFIENDKIRISPETKIIKAKTYTTISEAENILNKLHKRAESIKMSAKKAFRSEKERGYNDGLRNCKHQMAQEISSVSIQTEKYLHEIEDKIKSLVLHTVRKIIDEIEPHELISALVKKSLELMRHHNQIKLKVSPLHLDFLNDKINEIKGPYPNIKGIEIVAEDRLSKDQLILESPIGIVDASIDTQLNAIQDSFTRCSL
jgi:type III secretion protein L